MKELYGEALAVSVENLLFILIGIISAAAFVITLAAVPVVLVLIPHDFFCAPRPEPGGAKKLVGSLLRILRNLFGICLLPAGVVMLFLPGQGLLTILLALSLIDFPGKRKAVRRILQRPGLRRAVDKLRSRWGKPRLEFPGENSGEISGEEAETVCE